jgi:hypothetical protein
MKSFQTLVLVIASLVLGACEKSDNVTQLHQDAVDIAKFYGPRVNDLENRAKDISARGQKVPSNLPDVPELVRRIQESGDKITEMKGITTNIEKQADEAMKAHKADELARLVDESHEKLDADWTIANEDLIRLESWLWQYEHNGAAQPPAPPPTPAAPLPTPNETGEPPPAAAGSGQGQGSAATPKAHEKATEKAAQKAAVEKVDTKSGQPKTEPKPPRATGSGAGSAK